MNNETSLFWLGILLSIPVGIATGLLSPRIQQWLDASGKRKALQASHEQQGEFEKVTLYKENPEEFTQYLIQTAIKTTFIGSLTGIVIGLFSLIGLTAVFLHVPYPFDQYIQKISYIFAQFFATIGAIWIVNICRAALSFWTKVKNYERYKENWTILHQQ